MSTQSEKTGSEELTEMDYERAKEIIRHSIENQDDDKSYPYLFALAVSGLMGMFKDSGSVPVNLLEYADKISIEKVIERQVK